jgi:hypothetical protein
LAGAVPTFRQPGQLFLQEGADPGQAEADAGQPLDGLPGLSRAARGVLDEAALALPAEGAGPAEAASLKLVEVALHGAGRDVGRLGDVFVGEALALQPKHHHLALDAGVWAVETLVADLRQHFRAEGEPAHGCLSASGLRASNHAVAVQSSSGNPAGLSRGEYKLLQRTTNCLSGTILFQLTRNASANAISSSIGPCQFLACYSPPRNNLSPHDIGNRYVALTCS